MRFSGVVGYAGESLETLPGTGVYEDEITEFPYSGDVFRDSRRLEEGEYISDDVVVNNLISIVADDKANQDFLKMKYVMFRGIRWTIRTVEVKPPRLLLTLGGVYHGPTP
jgi:hypothetical protein